MVSTEDYKTRASILDITTKYGTIVFFVLKTANAKVNKLL